MFNTLSLSDALLILSVVGPIVASLAATLYHVLFSQLPASKQATIRARIAEVVAAIDQAQQGVPGAQKKQLVTLLLNGVAKQFKVPSQELDVLIESAVSDLRLAQAQAGYTRTSVTTLAPVAATTTMLPVLGGFVPSSTGGDPVPVISTGAVSASAQPAPTA